MTLSSPSWRSLDPLKGSLNHPKKVAFPSFSTSHNFLQEQRAKLHKIILDAQFDFAYYADEEKYFVAAAQILENSEVAREYFGLECNNLITLVVQVKEILMNGTARPSKSDLPGEIVKYIRENLRFHDQKRMPSKETVEALLQISSVISKSARIQAILQTAKVAFGRDAIFEEPSKIKLMIQRTASTNELEFLVEALYCHMVRSKNTDKLSTSELSSKAGEIATWLFVRRYFQFLLRKYPVASVNAPDISEKAIGILNSPFRWLQEVALPPAESLTWIAALPEPQQLLFAHCRALLEGRWRDTLKGILASPPPGGVGPESFLKVEKVKTQFLDGFEAAYSRYLGKEACDKQDEAKVAW